MKNKSFAELSEENVEELVIKLKRRMKIVYKTEDDYLKDIIEQSYEDIVTKVGTDDLENRRVVQMIIERAKYSYDDALEFFDANFYGQLLNLSREFGGEY